MLDIFLVIMGILDSLKYYSKIIIFIRLYRKCYSKFRIEHDQLELIDNTHLSFKYKLQNLQKSRNTLLIIIDLSFKSLRTSLWFLISSSTLWRLLYKSLDAIKIIENDCRYVRLNEPIPLEINLKQ